MAKYILHIGTILLLSSLFLGCTDTVFDKSKKPDKPKYLTNPVNVDLKSINEKGYLTAIMDNSSTSYFIYRGQPMGYEYELLKLFSQHLKLPLKIVVANDLDEAFRMLNLGEGDILAHNLTVTKPRKKYIDFSLPHHQVQQVLVQRKPEEWRKMKLHEIEKELIRDPIQLIGKEVVVRKSSSFAERLQNLSEEIGGDIIVIEEDGSETTESLIKQVADGELNYTVADDDVAELNGTYFPILDVNTKLSLPQQIAWGLRKTSPQLKETLNSWLSEMKKEADYYVIYNKYFKNPKASKLRIRSEYNSLNGSKISSYDSLIKYHADRIGWDWLLMASLIYQESKFDPDAKSWAGAVGLMQLVERTAAQFGAENRYDPDQNVKAGANVLDWLDEYWEKHITDEQERLKFVLASFNVGQQHVEDARRLAEKYDADPNVWDDNVEKYLLLKSKPKYYDDPVVVAGYCRGEEPVRYVREILARYQRYRQLITEPVGPA